MTALHPTGSGLAAASNPLNMGLAARLRFMVMLGVVASLQFYLIFYLPRPGWTYNYGYYVGHDTFNFWAGAVFAATDMTDKLGDLTFYGNWLRQTFGGDFGSRDAFIFSYPPSALVFLKPFGALSYEWFVGWWSLANAIAGAAAAWLVTRGNKVITAMVLLSPAALGNFFHGQAGMLFAAALVSALYLLDRRPVIAGILLGLLTVKPHLAVVVAFIVLATGNWRAAGAGLVTGGAIVLASIWLFGTTPWENYFTVIMDQQGAFITKMELGYRRFFVTPYATLRSWGAGMYPALAMQAVLSLAAIAAAVIVWLRVKVVSVRVLTATLATVVASPYLNNYDMTIVVLGLCGWLAFALSANCRDAGQGRWAAVLPVWLVMAIWVVPAFSVLAGTANIMVTPFVLMAALVYIVREMVHSGTGPAPVQERRTA